MRTLNKDDIKYTFSVQRIETLTDGIFAIAMTLLVLTITLPKKGMDLTEVKLHKLLLGQAQEFFNYVLSFLLLAVFWVVHHRQFHCIRHTDTRHLWINIMFLMAVSFVPFSTSLAGDFPNECVAELFFSANMFIIGMLLCGNWAYATKNHRLVDPDLSRGYIAAGMRRSVVLPFVSFLAIMVSLISPSLSSYVFLLIPIILSYVNFKRKFEKVKQ